jgi:hypothetical protein
MWTVGHNQPEDQVNAVFENVAGLAEALDRLKTLKQEDTDVHAWARGPFYDIGVRLTDVGDIGFVVCPTVEADHDLPSTCRPFSKTELLELAAADDTIAPGEDECPTCNERRRGRYANRGASGSPLFLCSTCERWTETLPKVAKPGPRVRESDLAE